jgi:anti-sigma regulatory factor (Ser/Thr protein kinase)
MPAETLSLPGRSDFLPVARHAARIHFATVPDPVRSDLELVTSELATNAVLWSHSGDEGGKFDLAFTLDLVERTARVEVTDAGAKPKDLDAEAADELSAHGRGLQIVMGLAKEWGHESAKGRQTYWAVLTWS